MIRRRRIGILGGSFDPVHAGHLSVAQQVAGRLKLDEVILVPAGEPPHKAGRLAADKAARLVMARLAAHGLKGLSVSDLEVRRPGKSYTIDTLRQLKAEFGLEHEYFLIIGADTVGELPDWHRAAELLAEARFAVVARPGWEPDFDRVAARLGQAAADRLRAGLVETEPCAVSSTDIRKRAAAGEDITGSVRKSVADYIKDKGLYRRA